MTTADGEETIPEVPLEFLFLGLEVLSAYSSTMEAAKNCSTVDEIGVRIEGEDVFCVCEGEPRPPPESPGVRLRRAGTFP